jgi:hypothetical protein
MLCISVTDSSKNPIGSFMKVSTVLTCVWLIG